MMTKRVRPRALLQTFALLCIMGSVTAPGCADRDGPLLARTLQARDLASGLSIELTEAVTAANRAVMADAHEKTNAFAQDAVRQVDAIDRDRARLKKLLQGLDYGDELRLLDTFDRSFARYRELDHEVLQLAVDSSNLKAQRLAFGTGAQAVDAMSASLARATNAVATVPNCGGWQLRALLSKTAADVRTLQTLEAPHIDAAEDEAMTALEQRMTALETSARASLEEANTISNRVTAVHQEVMVAQSEFGRFLAIHREILALSRRNSNVRSIELALGQHRLLAMECQGNVRALSEELQKRGFRATR
jgi:hypothetical protein